MKAADYSVFEFNFEEELLDNCNNHWSKLSNPKFRHDFDPRTKYDFLQHASSGPITQMKESQCVKQIRVFSIDDDDRGLVSDDSGSFQNASIEAASKHLEIFGTITDRILQQSSHFNGDSVKPKSSSSEMKIKISSSSGQFSENDHMALSSPTIPESPYSNGSVDAGASNDCDSKESSPSTSGSEQEETTFPYEELTQDESLSGLDMEKMDGALPADYVIYGKMYYPACLIVFSETSLKIETESEAARFEWNIEDIDGIESQWCHSTSTVKVIVRILTKDAVPEENKQEGITGVEELEFLVHDPHWLQRQESIYSLNLIYRAIWRTGMNEKACEGGSLDSELSQPYIPKFKEPFDEVVYPKGDKDAVSISKTDVELLEPNTFLNDTIIDFYLKYLQTKIPPSERGRFYFFNSFFFTKLADPNKNTSGVFDGKAGFQRVQKWTRKVNIFEKDYIFIPVNYNLHWSLIVICHSGEVAKFNEENLDQSVKVPCVLHMDSIRGSHTGLKDLIQSYLLEEWRQKNNETSEDIVSKFSNMRFLSLELPQQENCSDCGLFLLHYAELFIEEAPENFSPFRINKFDKFLKPDWFIPAEASLKRVSILKLICDLLEERPLESTSTSNHEFPPPVLIDNHKNDNSIEFLSERTSPGKSWHPSDSQTVQGMDIDLLDMSLCSNVSCLDMRDLECQHYGQGASCDQPGSPAPPIKDVNVEHLGPSAFGQSKLQSIDEMAAMDFHLGYRPGVVNHGFQWNSELSDQGIHPDNDSPLSSNHSSEDSEVMVIEHEPEIEGPSSGENINSEQHKANADSLTESYASASCDMMETPAEDSQELSRLNLVNVLQNPSTLKLDKAKEMPVDQEFKEIEDDEVTAKVNDVVEDSSSDLDEGQAAKKIRLTPLGEGESNLVRSLTKETQV